MFDKAHLMEGCYRSIVTFCGFVGAPRRCAHATENPSPGLNRALGFVAKAKWLLAKG